MVVEKLLSISEPWLKYSIKLNILNENKLELEPLKKEALKDEKIQMYLKDISDFHSILVCNHKNPELPIHKLLFLLDMGFGTDIPQIEEAVNQIMVHKDHHGIYQSLTNVPKHYGGTGKDTFGWCLCDAPLMLLALIKSGINYDEHLKKSVDYLVSLAENKGFPCSVSEEFGKFRGPGRKDDCCSYATLIMLNLLTHIKEYKHSHIVKDCIDKLLFLWENNLERHPYMFYMGNDFRKLKAPSIWYDIISVADCLSKH